VWRSRRGAAADYSPIDEVPLGTTRLSAPHAVERPGTAVASPQTDFNSLAPTEVAMKGTSVVAIALSVLIRVGLASADELQGKVQTVDSSNRVVVLKDGTRLWLAEDVVVKQLQEGVTVKLSYEERNGKHVVTRIETAE
jgi:ferric-dicitrate binding protein FerR (iron transport regulator)